MAEKAECLKLSLKANRDIILGNFNNFISILYLIRILFTKSTIYQIMMDALYNKLPLANLQNVSY